ncbi:hypothetical protein O181_028752 [Austropuccinia psidii MF-1]|uniref:Uncharacterized protein n=1 Tax=Austropuccinia psidii MF-1 TaxID=1389203 RepID=A0A9Q3CSJ2_9BASI|nr:hypothetical protein [Austropuccinia psidii MF-1]
MSCTDLMNVYCITLSGNPPQSPSNFILETTPPPEAKPGPSKCPIIASPEDWGTMVKPFSNVNTPESEAFPGSLKQPQMASDEEPDPNLDNLNQKSFHTSSPTKNQSPKSPVADVPSPIVSLPSVNNTPSSDVHRRTPNDIMEGIKAELNSSHAEEPVLDISFPKKEPEKIHFFETVSDYGVSENAINLSNYSLSETGVTKNARSPSSKNCN